MKNLIREVHRRSLWQVLGIYLAGSWIALQVVEQLTEAAGLPDWVRPFSLVLLILGFPIVMATAFVQEGMSSKEPEAPQQSLADVGEVPPPPAPELSAAHGVLTWRNAVLGGVGAFALLGLLAAGWFTTRALGVGPAATLVAQGVLDERDPIVLADFASTGGDATLGDALTEALRIELGNSDVVDVVDGAGITQALRRMQRDPEDGLSRDIALDLAVREGYKAVIAGEVRELAGGYQLSAEVLSATDGSSLAGFRETARDADGLIDAIDNLSRDIRQKAGESIRSVRSGEPLDEVSTASLDALRRYSEGVRAFDLNDFARSRSLLEEAVAIDSGFAMAHRKLGAVYQNLRQQQALVDAMSAAYRHRERLTRTERLHVEGTYSMFVTGDRAAASRAYEQLLDLDPEDAGAANNLGVAIGGADPEREIELYRVGIDSSEPSVINYTNMTWSLVQLGRFDEAVALLQEGETRFPDAASIAIAYANVYSAADRWAEARSSIAAVREGFRGTYAAEVVGPGMEASIDAREGRLLRSREAWEALVGPIQEADGSAQDLIGNLIAPAYARLYSARDVNGAVDIADAVLERYPLDSFAASDRQTLVFADFFARAGDASRSRALLDKWQTDRIAGDPAPFGYVEASALADLADGQASGAIEALERLDSPAPARCESCLQFDLAIAHDEAGNVNEAIERYERHVTTPDAFRMFWGYYSIPFSLERLGELYESRGRTAESAGPDDLQKAAEYYGNFVELWAEADDELQPRVRAAQARLDEILQEIG